MNHIIVNVLRCLWL